MFAIFLVVAALPMAGVAEASDNNSAPDVRLSIAPGEGDRGWIDLELEPGEIATSTVVLRNSGAQTAAVHNYVADVATLTGGGMGSADREAPTTGTSTWVTFPDRSFSLGPDEQRVVPVEIRVPEDTPPGDYITSLALEQDPGRAPEGEGITLRQVTRRVIAVAVHVPGPASPALELGDVEHRINSSRSVPRIEVDNRGNRHLRATGTATVLDNDGNRLYDTDVSLSTIYAATATNLEVALPALLDPGDYLLDVHLRNDYYDLDVAEQTPFVVEAQPAEDSAGPTLPGQEIVDRIAEAYGIPPWVIQVVVSLLLTAIILQLWLLASRRRRRHIGPNIEVATSDAVPARPVNPTADAGPATPSFAKATGYQAAIESAEPPQPPGSDLDALDGQLDELDGWLDELAAVNAGPPAGTERAHDPSADGTETASTLSIPAPPPSPSGPGDTRPERPGTTAPRIDPGNFTARPPRRRRRVRG